MSTNGTGRPSRAELTEVACALRAEGATQREIAEILEISKSYAVQLYTDPDGSRAAARKRSYANPCPGCGRMLSGSNGRGPNASKMCNACTGATRKVWTRDRLIAAIQEYADRYGHPPGARDWNPSMSRLNFRDDIADRFYEDGCWPHANTIQVEFGSWSRAIAAAGFTPLRPGHKYVDRERVA